MKTNVTMRSEKDRNLFGVVIRQETKKGFLCLSDLQTAYDKEAIKWGWSSKKYTDLLNSTSNLERIYYILYQQDYIKMDFNAFMNQVETETPAKLLKKLGAYKTTGARKTKFVSCDPYIWVLFAMEMNPKFYATSIVWLTDHLIINRIEAGNFYRALTDAIRKWNPDGNQYITLAKALNHIIFGRHEAGIRNAASTRELKELEDLEKKMAFAVDMGYITSWDMLLTELRKIYQQKTRNLLT